jgi:hypothetical protein
MTGAAAALIAAASRTEKRRNIVSPFSCFSRQ